MNINSFIEHTLYDAIDHCHGNIHLPLRETFNTKGENDTPITLKDNDKYVVIYKWSKGQWIPVYRQKPVKYYNIGLTVKNFLKSGKSVLGIKLLQELVFGNIRLCYRNNKAYNYLITTHGSTPVYLVEQYAGDEQLIRRRMQDKYSY